MPTLSKRVQDTFASPFRKFLPLARATKKRGIEVIHLNIGQPDFAMPTDLLNNLWDDSKPNFVPYGVAEGEDELRKAWTAYYSKFNVDLRFKDLIVTTGASEAILFALLGIADAGDEIIVPEPFYANYNGFAQMAGVNIVSLFSSIEDGFPIPKIEDFERTIGPRTRGILLSNPNNPSGKVYDEDTLIALAALAKQYNLYLLVDEAYSEFVYEGFSFYSAMQLSGADDHVIVIDSISKRFNACGTRVGALISRNHQLLENITRYARLRLSPPMLGQAFSIKALQLPSEYHDRLRTDFSNRRSRLLERLDQMEDVLYHAPEGAFYLFVQLPIDDSDRFCAWLLTDFEYEGRTVMLAPGTGFYSTPGKGKDEVRIAYILDVDHLNNAMDCLEAALKVYPGLKKPVASVV
ncbi:MAG: pyridoxal phosphate-dependent aminotransferase [Saprospiraceae bacterium]|nr:pyridoxal phosphate-dependent aminotransferase [Saprospiraceae bacterium]